VRSVFKTTALALGIASPLLMHFAILGSHATLAACLTATLAILMLWPSVPARLRVGFLALALLVCLAATFSEAAALSLVYVAPVAVYVAVGALFGRTLMPGREPLVCRIARLDRGGELPDDLARYARGVTWAWTALLTAFTVVSIMLALFGTPQAWSWFNNVWAFVLMAALFAGEYGYRLIRFRHYPHSNPLRVALLMARNAPELLR